MIGRRVHFLITRRWYHFWIHLFRSFLDCCTEFSCLRVTDFPKNENFYRSYWLATVSIIKIVLGLNHRTFDVYSYESPFSSYEGKKKRVHYPHPLATWETVRWAAWWGGSKLKITFLNSHSRLLGPRHKMLR